MSEDATDGATRASTGGDARFWALLALFVLAVEAAALLAYVTRPNTRVTDPWPMLYPFVWIDVSLAALAGVRTRASPASASTRSRLGAGVLAVGYFLVLAHFGGLYGFAGRGLGLSIDTQLPPGASPALVYSGPSLALVLQPYKVLGYLTLTSLVYRTVVRATGTASSAVSGVVGLFSCVSCSWPLVGLALSMVFGGSSAVAAVALTHDYVLSTAIFLSSVALLYWRPSFRRNPLRWLAGP